MSHVLAPAPDAVPRRKERWWLHGLLLFLTFLTTVLAGAYLTLGFRPEILRMSDGWGARRALLRGGLDFSLPILCILVAHELGHYLTARRYGIDASPPFFIPFLVPPWVNFPGTMGAFIRIREPFRTKSQLFDVGVAGPIAGFVVSLPFLAWGVAHCRSNIDPAPLPGTMVFHYPFLVTLFQRIFVGRTFASIDTIEHPMFMAAWFGLFVTALNLLPLGQLDGGHAIYAIFGRFQRLLAIPLLLVLAILGLKWPGWWVWVVFTLVTGIRHPAVLNENEPLDTGRKLVAAAVLLIFVLCFAPIPIEIL
jgi:membrane-associated protease RseP (regulator of RpoE activity)